ncbi:MAG: hypothetical protein KJ770_03245 [Actinobacteria bacterium]|nr:hypothetical protein [Actinomycetota bacterium]MBU4450749.1 hypothetical protein [Actinomycetota bacterium]MCG2789285.1 hypothetical protein [Actinomycetes bacterium]
MIIIIIIFIMQKYLADEKINTEGEFIVGGYSPPWIPRFLARNEAMIKLKG